MGPNALGTMSRRNSFLLPKRRLYARLDGRRSSTNKITRKLSIGFKPYTLVACQGPSNVNNAQWSRVWEGNRWMPFNWANTNAYDLNPSGISGSLYMYGPYLVPNTPRGGDLLSAIKIYGNLTIYLQFRGQRW